MKRLLVGVAICAALTLRYSSPVHAQTGFQVLPGGCGTASYPGAGTKPGTQDSTGHVCTNGGGGGGGNSTIVAPLGTQTIANSVAVTDNSWQSGGTAYTALTGATPAGTNLIGKVGIDQTTNGTTNAVNVPDGNDVTLGSKADSATCATTNTLMACARQLHADVTSAIPSGTNDIGVVEGKGTAGTASGGVFTIQGAASMTKLLVTPDSVALPANQSVNVSQINAVTPLMGNGVTGTGSQRVTIASDNTAFAVNAAITAASGSVASGAVASGAVASGAIASGAYASGSISDGAEVTLGAKADAATCATTNTLMACARQLDADVKAAVPTGTNYIGQTGTIPPGTAETCASGNVANGTVACTLATTSGKTTYIAGFAMTSNGATGALAVNCTLTGTITGTMTFTYTYEALATLASLPLIVQFNPPIPASTTNTTIVASCPAGGTGAANAAMNAWGFQL